MEEQEAKAKLRKYKNKILEKIQSSHLYSVMNNTKWRELRESMINDMPFPPPYIMKTIASDAPFPPFDKDVWYIGDWNYENFYPFFDIEWIKVRPRHTVHRGKLIEDEILDETPEFISILEKYNIPYEEENGVFTIYGYKKA